MWPRAGSLVFLIHFLGYKILLLNSLPSKLQGFCLCLSTAGTIITWCSVDAGDLSALPSPFHADVPKNSISNHVTPFRSSCLGDRGNHRSDYFPSENRNYGKDPGLQFCPQAPHALPSSTAQSLGCDGKWDTASSWSHHSAHDRKGQNSRSK